MKICIHRGAKEIGGSCVELESQGQRLLLDLGLPLDAEENDIKYLPEIPGLDGNDPSLLGILISHPHLDHFGLLAHISQEIPIGMGKAARSILKAAIPFLPGNWPLPAGGWDYESGKSFDIGVFRITPYLVDHSAYDAYALLIEAEGKRLFYSGDFRAHGRKSALFDHMIANPPKNIDVLLMEGSSIGRIAEDQQFPSENDLQFEFEKVFQKTKGLALVQTSSQNIDRLVSILKASKNTGRKLVFDLYTAAVLEATGNKHIPQSTWDGISLFVPQSQRVKIRDNAWLDLLKRHSSNRIYVEALQESPDKHTLLFRAPFIYNLNQGNFLDGANYIYSMWEGYWERGSYDRVKKWLKKKNIPKQSIHTSGHASTLDLKKFVVALAPKKLVPIHTFVPDQFDELFQNVDAHDDGEWWEV